MNAQTLAKKVLPSTQLDETHVFKADKVQLFALSAYEMGLREIIGIHPDDVASVHSVLFDNDGPGLDLLITLIKIQAHRLNGCDLIKWIDAIATLRSCVLLEPTDEDIQADIKSTQFVNHFLREMINTPRNITQQTSV